MARVRMMTVWPSVLASLNPLQIQNIGRGLGVTGRGWRHPCSFGDSTSSCQGAGCILHSCEINIQHTDYLQQDPFTMIQHERNNDTNEGEIMHQVLDFFIVEGRIVTLTQCVCYILNFLNADIPYLLCVNMPLQLPENLLPSVMQTTVFIKESSAVDHRRKSVDLLT